MSDYGDMCHEIREFNKAQKSMRLERNMAALRRAAARDPRLTLEIFGGAMVRLTFREGATVDRYDFWPSTGRYRPTGSPFATRYVTAERLVQIIQGQK